jgi:hypothetical protein
LKLGPRELLRAIDFRLSEILKLDLVVGIGAAAGGIWLALSRPERLDDVLNITIASLGVVIGAVLAGAAILGAFLDQSFLSKLKRIDADPVRYFGPFFFTAFVGTIGLLISIVTAAVGTDSPPWLFASLTGAAGLATGWAIASVLYDLDVLVQFLRLQEAAAEVSDESGKGPGGVRQLPQR